jgi:hypothetical protein
MAETFVASLKKLAREKRGLREKERQVAHAERRVIEHIGRLLSGAGYRLVPIGGGHLKAGRTATATPTARVNIEGVPSPRPRCDGGPRSWTPSSIRALLLNPTYKGLIVWGRVTSPHRPGSARPWAGRRSPPPTRRAACDRGRSD